MMNEGMGVDGTSGVELGRIDVESDIETERRSPGVLWGGLGCGQQSRAWT